MDGKRIKNGSAGCLEKRNDKKVEVFEVPPSRNSSKKIHLLPLERESEAVADVDPDDLEDALAGNELDEQDAEEAHLVLRERGLLGGGEVDVV
jgi:hypothetical protein